MNPKQEEEDSTTSFIVAVQDRSEKTLLPLIQKRFYYCIRLLESLYQPRQYTLTKL